MVYIVVCMELVETTPNWEVTIHGSTGFVLIMRQTLTRQVLGLIMVQKNILNNTFSSPTMDTSPV